MENLTSLFSNVKPLLFNALILFACVSAGFILQWLIFKWIRIRNQKRTTIIRRQILNYLDTPTKFLLPLIIVYSTLPYLDFRRAWFVIIEILLIINFSWLVINILQAIERIIKNKFEIDEEYEIRERQIMTQFKFLKNVIFAFIVTVGIAIVLWNIPGVKELGKGLLTTAGIASIILGFAAQKSISNLIAGFQIAFTQPIKIGDIVIVEEEWGRVEDISLTYVVIKTWDWRRLVLPLNYFIEKPFENWTMSSSDLIGRILLYVDYTFPVQKLREELLGILEEHPLWDKNIASLLVTKSNERTIELRVTFSARNSSDVWNMRCEIREQLITFIQKKYPHCLPLYRMENHFTTPDTSNLIKRKTAHY